MISCHVSGVGSTTTTVHKKPVKEINFPFTLFLKDILWGELFFLSVWVTYDNIYSYIVLM